MQQIRNQFLKLIGKLLIAVVILSTPGLFLPQEAQAAVITWNGGGGDNSWSTGANWAGGVAPGTSDIAVFDGTSTKDATIDVSIDVAGIDINSGYSGTITQAPGVTIDIGTSHFDISDGTFIGGDSAITFDAASDFTVSGGSFTSTSGDFTIERNFTVSSGTFEPSTGTVITTGGHGTWDVATSETLNNLTINNNNGWRATISSGDTIVVTGGLTLTDGVVNTGTIEVHGDITQGALFDGGTATIEFANDAAAQTYTLNGGEAPFIELDSAADADDSLVFTAATQVDKLTTTADFSGTIPISNPSDFVLSFINWDQAAGTIDASAQTEWEMRILTISGGTFTPPALVTVYSSSATWDVNTSETFQNIDVSKNNGNGWNISAADTIVVTGDLILTNGVANNGTVEVHGDITQAATFDGGDATIEFANDAAAQTYTLNGGEAPFIELDSAADADDSLAFTAATQVNKLTMTADFSGTIPISNPSDAVLSFTTWEQAAGTIDASAQTEWEIRILTISGGTFTPPQNVVAFASGSTWDVNVSETFQNLEISKGGHALTIPSGDTLIVAGDLTLTNGSMQTGTIEAHGDITQDALFDGGSGTIEFANDAVAQTYTLNGGDAPNIELDSAADANDSLVFNAATEIAKLTITADFSGAIPISNPSDAVLSFVNWDQAAGTIDASAQTEWEIRILTISGGTFTPPPSVVAYSSGSTWDVNVSETFQNLELSKGGHQLVITSGDTIVVTGDLTLTNGSISTGTVEVHGDVTAASIFDGGTATMRFVGSETQTLDFTDVTDEFNGDIHVDKTGGQVNMASALDMDAQNQDLVIQEGVFNLAGHALNVEGSGGLFTVEDGGTFMLQGAEILTLNADQPTLSSGSTVTYTGDGDAGADTYTLTTLKDAYHHLAINSTDGATDTFQLGAALDVNGNFSNSGTVDVTATDYAVNVAGNWSNTGAFTAQEGTVTLDGTGQTISGTTTFHNFTKTVAAPDTLTFPATLTQTFMGALTLNGALDNQLSLRSSSPGTQVRIDPQGSRSLTYLDVQDNNNINATVATCTNGCVSSGNNTNWDLPGFSVSAISGNTTEAGGQATFTVVLTAEPGDDVFIPVSSDDTTEGTVSTDTLTFTSANWDTPQTVTVTGVDDDVVDGDIDYTAVLGTTSSADSAYHGINVDDVSVTNEDDDTAGYSISAISGDTSEDGDQATFTVALISEPIDDVTIGVSSSDTSEGTVDQASLTFTSENWDTPQTVTVTGQDDGIEDGDVEYTIVLAAATSNDDSYDGLNPDDVTVTNLDDDGKGITVSAISRNTTEAGQTATFTIVLDAMPSADVTIGLSSDDTTEGTVSPSSVTFTDQNWDTPQTVTVTGVDDDVDDGDIAYTIVTAAATSGDGTYNGMNADDVSVTNVDNDTAGVTVGAISGDTTEGGGTATFTVVLDSEPTDDVSIGVTSSDTGEGTVDPASLTFTSANWDDAQTVTVTGQDDAIFDGDIDYTIVLAAATSGDGNYNALNPDDVSVTNADNDTPGFDVSAISGNTTEAGGTATFTVVLTSRPAEDVTTGVTSSDTTEGVVDQASLTFTNANWDAPQTVTVTGVDDDVDDGDIAYTIVLAAATSADGDYDALNPDDVSATNTDDDTAGVTVSAISGNTTEGGGTATFTVVLDSEPTDDVSIGISSSDTGEGTVSAASLTFTSGNWDAAQTITVTGVDDEVDDGNIVYTILTAAATSGDSNYNALNPDDVSVTNTDNDSAGAIVSAISGNTTEGGGTATFTVVLVAEPTADVTIGVTSNDTGEGTVDQASLTFTNANWDTPQTVTVTGINDDLDDGDVVYTIVLAAATSADSAYNGMDADDVSVTNIDDDSAGFTVSAISGNTTEAGGQAAFTIVLNAEPTATVFLTNAISSSDTTEGTVSPTGVEFTTANWDTPQTITVTGVDDEIDDGDIGYTIVIAAATSGDSDYHNLDPDDVSVTNEDDDTAGVTVSAISGNTTEAGGTATFTMVLDSEPTADVSIVVVSDDAGEGTASPANPTFTSANWDTPRTITVTGVDDDIDDGDVAYTITLAPAVSADAVYNELDPDDVSVTNEDGDTAGVTVSAISGNTTEAGGTATFTIVLDTEPTEDVSMGISSDNTDEGTVSPSTVTFTSANWDTEQTVTVTGVDDFTVDGNIAYNVVIAAATSVDENYDGIDPDDLSLSNIDNDTPSSGGGSSVQPMNTSLRIEGVETCSPDLDVTIKVAASNVDEIVVSDNDAYLGADWQPFVIDTSLPYTRLPDGTVVGTMAIEWMLMDTNADQYIYVRFRSSSGNTSPLQSGAINLGSIPDCAEDVDDDEGEGGEDGEGEEQFILLEPGDYVKGENFSTVYYVDENLNRHPFYDEQTYFTYHDDFNNVKVLPDVQLRRYGISTPVLPNPDTVLVKVISAPHVYFVDEREDGAFVLHWIPSEEKAEELFGSAWTDHVLDMAPTIWGRYELGDPVSGTVQVPEDLPLMTRVEISQKREIVRTSVEERHTQFFSGILNKIFR